MFAALIPLLAAAAEAAPAAAATEAAPAAAGNIVGDSAGSLPIVGDGASSATKSIGCDGAPKGKEESNFIDRIKEGWNSGKSSNGEMPPMVDQSRPTNYISPDAGSILAQLQRY